MIRAEINQGNLKGGQRIPLARVDGAMKVLSKALKVRGNELVSIGFVSTSIMRKLNKTWRKKDKITDVLSFNIDEGELKGEIILSYEQAKRQAKAMKHSTRDELIFLIVHGVLHVYGHDHEQAKDKKKMFTLQESILNSLGIDSRL
jgi:probable rRNA maturation factor